ncbi:hypothetical protein D3C80_823500 [compost metagenome]
MLVGLGQAGDVGNLVHTGTLECFAQWLAMVDHQVSAQFLHPALGLRTRSGADDFQGRQLVSELRKNRAHATCRADDQQALAFIGFAFAHLQALEQQFPRRDRGERQGSGFGESEGLGHVADDALVHHMQLAVAARPRDGASVKHLVADREQRHLTAHGLDHTGHVPTQHFGRAAFGLDVLAHLGVHRVDRDGFDFHEQVAGAGNRLWQLDVLQSLVVADRQRGVVGNGFHGRLLNTNKEGIRWGR